MKKTIFLMMFIVVLLMNCNLVYGQQFIKIEGTVVDEKDIPLANVSLRIGNETGTITNNEGSFILKFPEELIKDSLLVSYMGYQNLKILLSDLKKDHPKIKMQPEVLNLNEIAIYSVTAEAVIKNAVRNIPLNYETKKFEMIGFYREMGQIDGRYLSFAEASLNILSAGYQQKREKDLIIINKERNLKKIGEQEVNNPFNTALRGLPYLILENDIVRNPGAIFGKDYLSKYNYEITGGMEVDGEEAYVVSFDQKEGIKEALYKGTVVVIKSSYAIVSIDFTFSPKGVGYASSDIPFLQRPLMRLFGYHFQKLDEELSGRYIKINGKWYPYYYKIATTHDVKAKKEHIEGKLYISAELFISRVNEKPGKNYDKASVIPSSYSFQQTAQDYSDDYWGEYNFIKPSTSLKKIAEKVMLINQIQYIRNLGLDKPADK